jgi:hypothetical protein
MQVPGNADRDGAAEAQAAGLRQPASQRTRRRLAAIAVGGLAAAWLAALASTHAVLSGGFAGWSGATGGDAGLTTITAAEQATIGPTPGYSQVLWAARPGGEVTFGFSIHNGGLVPVTILGLALRTFDPGVVNALAPAGAQLGPGFGQMLPFHASTVGPGGSLAVGLTERVVCDPTIRRDASLLGAVTSWLGDATSPVVLRYRVLGVTTSQTVSIATPLLVILPYRSCRD